MAVESGKVGKCFCTGMKWAFLSAIVVSLAFCLLMQLIIRDDGNIENIENVSHDAEVMVSRPLITDQYKIIVPATLERPFITQTSQLYLRTFTRSKTSRKKRQSTACDKEALRAPETKKKLIVFYNVPDWWLNNFNFSICECSHCELVSSQNITQADIVLFDGVRLSVRKPPPRPRGQIWVVIGNEAPISYTGVLHTPHWRGVFNWTSTHRVDSDIFHPYGLLLDNRVSRRTRGFYESLAKSKRKLAVAVISHCSTKSLREKYIKELQQYMPVDVIGFCGTKTTCPKRNDTCLSELLQPYVFLLAFENSLCVDYVTEKFLQTFNDDFHVIPVVRGGTDYHRYFPDGTFIDTADFNSPKDLAKYLNRVGKDHTKVADMLVAKSRYKRISVNRQCHICYLLHKYNITTSGIDPRVSAADRALLTKTYTDVFRWLIQDKCFHPHDFTSALRTYSNKNKFTRKAKPVNKHQKKSDVSAKGANIVTLL